MRWWNKFWLLVLGVALGIVGHSFDLPEVLWAGFFIGATAALLFAFVPDKR